MRIHSKITFVPAFLFSILLVSIPASATTTVTVDNDKVTIEQDKTASTVSATTVQTGSQTVAAQTTPRDPRELEGEIIRVDQSKNEILVRDTDNRERRILLKQGMISNYKVGDYVKIYLMADMREAKTVKTQAAADLEGEVVSTDTVASRMVVRDERGKDHVVLLSPEMNGKNQVGDHVRLYVVSDSPERQEVRLIRVR